MEAVVLRGFGGPEVLRSETVPDPQPGPGEVLVRVRAVSVGRTLDLAARAGRLYFAKLTFPHILGSEHAGDVVGLGVGVDGVQVGDRVAVGSAVWCGRCTFCQAGHQADCVSLQVLGIHRPGAYAELTATPVANVELIPDELSYVEAAALALNGALACDQLEAAEVAAGDWVLVQAAASAAGTMAVAVAHHRGARVIATSRAPAKRARLAAVGADVVLDSAAVDFVDRVQEATDGLGVAAAIDNVGSPELWSTTMAALATRGVVVTSGAFTGSEVGIDLRRLYLRSQRIVGVRTASLAGRRRLWQHVAEGLRPVVDRTFALSAAADAHRYLEGDDNFGRVVLTV